MEQKLLQVVSWLKKKYGDYIPSFDINEKTVDYIYKRVKNLEAEERDTSFLIEDMKHSREEYEAEIVYMKNLLTGTLSLTPACLSSKGIRNLNTLVDCAMTLQVKDTSLSSFFSAMNAMTLEIHETELKNRQMTLEIRNTHKKITSVLTLEQKLKTHLGKLEKMMEAEEMRAEDQSDKFTYLKNKCQDLAIRIKDATEKLAETGLEAKLTHKALVNLSEELCAKQKEVQHLKTRLKSYYSLPPSHALAKVMVEEAKRTLADLDEELSQQFQKMFD